MKGTYEVVELFKKAYQGALSAKVADKKIRDGMRKINGRRKMIGWKKDAVCFWCGKQWKVEYADLFCATIGRVNHGAFQLNEIREGDYIESSELDTEEKHNDAVDVFRLFGFSRNGPFALTYRAFMRHELENTLVCSGKLLMGINYANSQCKRKITYAQLMAIGKLKRAMIERDEVVRDKLRHGVWLNEVGFGSIVSDKSVDTASAGRRNKSKQAYAILKSLDYEYDLNKQKWYKKEWV